MNKKSVSIKTKTAFKKATTAFSFKKSYSSLVIIAKSLYPVYNDAEAPPQIFLLIVHFL
jgi:uncharacterized protein GlcG (DUF336 family)